MDHLFSFNHHIRVFLASEFCNMSSLEYLLGLHTGRGKESVFEF